MKEHYIPSCSEYVEHIALTRKEAEQAIKYLEKKYGKSVVDMELLMGHFLVQYKNGSIIGVDYDDSDTINAISGNIGFIETDVVNEYNDARDYILRKRNRKNRGDKL